MLNAHNLYIWAKIEASIVEVEGMKWENIERKRDGFAIAYSERSFMEVATNIRILAENLDLSTKHD